MDKNFIESFASTQQQDLLKQIDSEMKATEDRLNLLKKKRVDCLSNFKSPVIQSLQNSKWVAFASDRLPEQMKKHPTFLELALRTITQDVRVFNGDYKIKEFINDSFIDDAVCDILFGASEKLQGFGVVDFFNVDWKSYLKNKLSEATVISYQEVVSVKIDILLVRIKTN